MQSFLKVMEFNPQGCSSGLVAQKVAVKLPAGYTDGNAGAYSGFAEIMAALMRMPAERLAQSLTQFDQVALEGEAGQWVPMINLADPETGDFSALDALLQSSAGASPLSSALEAALPTLDNMDGRGKDSMRALPDGCGASPLASPLPEVTETPPGEMQRQWAALYQQGRNGSQSPADVQGTLSAEDQGLAGGQAKSAAIPFQAAVGAHAHSGQQQTNQKREKQFTTPDTGISLQPPAATVKDGPISRADKHPLPFAGGDNSVESNPAGASAADAADAPDIRESLTRGIRETSGMQTAQSHGGHKPAIPSVVMDPSAAQPGAAAPEATAGFSSGRGIETGEIESSPETPEMPSASKQMQTDLIRQIVQRMHLQSNGRHSQMNIQLKPAVLGKLHMEIVTENQNVLIRMTAESHRVKEIIEQNVQLLKAELQQHGLQVQKLDVTVTPDGDLWRDGQQQMTFRQTQDHHRQKGGRHGAQDPDTDAIRGPQAADAPAKRYSNSGEVDLLA